MKLYKKCTAKLYPLLVSDNTITSDNPYVLEVNFYKEYKK